MANPNQIKIIFLSLIYFVLLLSVILPHHHHEELACFTTTHCEDESAHENEMDDHHHDEKNGENAEQCISIDYYIVSAAGKNLKQIYIPVFVDHGHDFLNTCKVCCEDQNHDNDLNANLLIFDEHDRYTIFLQRNIPLRAPPVELV